MQDTIPQPGSLAEEVVRLREEVIDLGEAVAGLGQGGQPAGRAGQGRQAHHRGLITAALGSGAGERQFRDVAERRHGLHAVPEVAR
jgi:hypothetical protein